MEGKATSLPEGTKFEVDGIKYIVKDGKVMTEALEDAVAADTQLALPLDPPAEPVAAAVEPVVEPVVAAAEPAVEPVVAPTGTPDEVAILAIIQPKLDEIYQMIAELKAASTTATPVDPNAAPVKMSIHDRFAEVMKKK